ncbi:HPr(Ser) kinase/phosphatase [Thiorhodovibrio frisius]|uniref:HPr kinase/phosphorylase n=1 Tax=Thiorhodovibrio frisius TaxID=631362 RepID=H8YZT3_9GAMM|nr:HPr(Ser) kinase/phosphatase [Thiorhodovibrio frisius]EIC22210.1 serine kinase of the HPr protein, regulates carbohydrate metabolism [Thiorhodovibrio frisius]WPL24504.1 HPr kinase/phosphorylase [Thiorhodovibrio frisius]
MKAIDSLQRLVDSLSKPLKLRWVLEPPPEPIPLTNPPQSPRQRLVGSMNCIRPNRVQIIGPAESAYLGDLHPDARADMMTRVFTAQPIAVIFSDGLEPDPEFRALAEREQTPLLGSGLNDQDLVEHLQHVLTYAFAERITLHGVFLEVLGMGVLLVGDPGIGKSELALELIARGHRLIADDAPEFARVAPEIIEGRCPPLLRDFLEVRGLGVLNIRAMFGESAVRETDHLKLVISMRIYNSSELAGVDRLLGSLSARTILGIAVPEITIPVAPGRNLAVLLETAVRSQILRIRGYDAGADLAERQAELLAADAPAWEAEYSTREAWT